MPDENEPTNELETPANDLQAPDTAPLFKQAIEEMMLTRKVLTEQGGQILERLDRVEKELRQLSRKIDVFGDDLMRARIDIRDLDARVTELEQKPA
jgi:uncharacterized protein (UPF0335 family)